MTQVWNDPISWPTINTVHFLSYFMVASSTAVIYDWALTFGQEFELVWRQQWSFMTFLYLSVRYIGILYSVINILIALPSVSLTDVGCTILNVTIYWMTGIVCAMLGVIIIVRLYAMYQGSRKILIFLVVSLLPSTITYVVFAVLQSNDVSWEELVLSGTYQCVNEGYNQLLPAVCWIIGVVWEVIALCLAVRTAVIHFRELRHTSTGWSIGDLFAVLIKTHAFYFAAYVAGSCINFGLLSPTISDSSPVGVAIYSGVLIILEFMQMFVLGPRLILSIREYHAELVADSDARTAMTLATIAFQERVQVTTGSGV